MELKDLLGKRLAFAGIVLVVVILAVYLRSIMLHYQGFFEPDGFFYYSVVAQTLANHLIVPHYSLLSGFPSHNPIGEAPGLIYITIIPYLFLQFLGISYYTVMRTVPILFGLLSMLGAYLLATKMLKNRWFGLLAAAFVAFSIGNLGRTSAIIYRGDSFIGVFLIFSLLFMVKCFEEENKRKQIAWALISGFLLGLGPVVWNGSPYIMATYMLSVLLIMLYGFLLGSEKVLRSVVIVSLFGLLFAYLTEHIYILLGLARFALPLLGLDFVAFYVPILLAGLLGYYMLRSKGKIPIASTVKGRLIILAGVLIIILIVAVLLIGQIISYLNGVFGVSAQVGQTTQELQATTLSFVLNSFNIQFFLSFIGIAAGLIAILYVALGKGGRKDDKAWITASVAFLAVLAYFMITGYMQSREIRFNAIFSIPVAIIAAYGVYGLWKSISKLHDKQKLAKYAALIMIDVVLLYMLYTFQPLSLFPAGYAVAVTCRIIGILLIVCAFAYEVYSIGKKSKVDLHNAFIFLVLVFLVYAFLEAFFVSAGSVQADGINPQFLSAVAWIRNNTPANATFDAVWTDGSVIEGWANRTSLTDSVGGENSSKITPFHRFLLNDTPDTQYLYSAGKPDYILAREYWYNELEGIAVEANLSNLTGYGETTLTNLSVQRNGSKEYYLFTSDAAPYYKAEMIISSSNGTNSFAAFIGTDASSQLQEIRYVTFYNLQNDSYSIDQSAVNNTLNYTLLVSYIGSSITGGTIIGNRLFASNLFKLTLLCNFNNCPYDNKNVTLTTVFMNNDTRIYKVNYMNGTS